MVEWKERVLGQAGSQDLALSSQLNCGIIQVFRPVDRRDASCRQLNNEVSAFPRETQDENRVDSQLDDHESEKQSNSHGFA